ncbi:MAG: hypothetical protein IIY96_03260 [Lachnospiraceae bacterium]|nr:hypothetical protein [Lachnospiraceae bacterium]
MIIRVLDQNYFVQETIPSEDGLVQYVCTNVSEDDGRICRIVRIPLQDVKPALIEYLADIFREGQFRELIQYANEAGYLHVVTDCGPAKARSLKDRLEKDVIPLKERLAMGEKFLKQLILSNVPVFFAQSAMDTAHVLFTDADECSFVFELEHLERFADADKEKMLKGTESVLSGLFAKELDQQKLPEMQAFLDRIVQGEYSGTLSLYQAYRSVEAELRDVDEDSLEPKSFLWRLWDKIKLLASHAEKLFIVVVFAIAIAYLVWSVRNLLKPTVQRDIYPSIGDERILSRSGNDMSASKDAGTGGNDKGADGSGEVKP